jgi:hypothetical protein
MLSGLDVLLHSTGRNDADAPACPFEHHANQGKPDTSTARTCSRAFADCEDTIAVSDRDPRPIVVDADARDQVVSASISSARARNGGAA